MLIMCWVGRCKQIFLIASVLVGCVRTADAGARVIEVDSSVPRVQLNMDDGSVYGLKRLSGVNTIFYDSQKHPVGQGDYISVFKVMASNSLRPTGFCGAGSEVWLHVYVVVGAELKESIKVLVSSCLSSFSLASLNTGKPMQEADFSSIRWLDNGFSIEWFNKRNAAGDSIGSTRYGIHDATFRAVDGVSEQ